MMQQVGGKKAASLSVFIIKYIIYYCKKGSAGNQVIEMSRLYLMTDQTRFYVSLFALLSSEPS